jgi:hypothetical protein
MSKTTQYTYGVIGASESSTTSAIDFVPAGAPAQLSGGEAGRLLAQVNRPGKVPCTNTPSDTVMTLGAVTVTPEDKSPHPASGTTAAVAATAVATRLAGPRRRRCPLPASHFTRQSLGPAAGCGSRYGKASPSVKAREAIQNECG